MIRPLAISLGVALLMGTAVASVQAGSHAATKITPEGVGGVKVDRKFQKLREAGLVGRMRSGCELEEDSHSAKLKRPLRGMVNLTRKKPRRVRDVQITGGATARGVGIGATRAEVKEAFPGARFDRGTVDVFGIVLVKVPKRAGGKLQMTIDADTKRVTLIAVPFVAFCE
jgi:hypothetical protein